MLKGLSQLKAKIAKAKDSLAKKLEKAVEDELTLVLEDSRENYVPTETGTLRDDSGVTVTISDGSVSGAIYYGAGPAREYAIPVHETPSKHDPPSWNGKQISFKTGGPKYLELPLRVHEKEMLSNIGKRVELT